MRGHGRGERDERDGRIKIGKEMSPKEMQQRVLDYFEERFGLGRALFDDYGLYLASKGRVYLGPKRTIGEPRVVTLGLLMARVGGAVKPSTNILQAFGRHVSRNFIGVSKEQAVAFARGGDVSLAGGQSGACSDGYVLMRYSGIPLGCGLLSGARVKNMLPKAKRLEVRYI